MKVIITGATGFAGSQVLKYALAHPSVTDIVLLQRRELPNPPSNSNGKNLETVILTDFSSYLDNVMARLAGAKAVLRALGGKHDNFPDLATAERVNVEFIQAAAGAFEQSLVPTLPVGKKLRFVLCSGHGALWDMKTKKPWIFAEIRRMKGAAEQAIFAMAKAVPDAVEAYTCHPAVIVSTEPSLLERVHGILAPSVSMRNLGATMVELGVSGSEDQFWEVSTMDKVGRHIIKARGI